MPENPALVRALNTEMNCPVPKQSAQNPYYLSSALPRGILYGFHFDVRGEGWSWQKIAFPKISTESVETNEATNKSA